MYDQRTDRASGGIEMPIEVNQPGDIRPGDLFEDCRFHPCLCIEGGSDDDLTGVHGISLVDGTPCGCSIEGCGLRKLTVDEAVQWKYEGPSDVDHSLIEVHWWNFRPQKPHGNS
jgi:hypothetical protein